MIRYGLFPPSASVTAPEAAPHSEKQQHPTPNIQKSTNIQHPTFREASTFNHQQSAATALARFGAPGRSTKIQIPKFQGGDVLTSDFVRVVRVFRGKSSLSSR